MARSVFLLYFPSPVFPAHWALWIPLPTNTKLGKLINVLGDPSTGFTHDIQRSYDLSEETRSWALVLLDDAVPEGCISDDGPDVFEEHALLLPPPTKSLIAPSAELASGKRVRVKIQNCQTWLREYLDGLVRAGILRETAADAIRSAPVN